jgi:hypothetical protein
MKAVKILLCVVALSLFVVQGAFAEVSLSADVETNTTVEMDSNGSDLTDMNNDGRVKFTLESKMENEEGFFGAAKGSAEIKITGEAEASDAYVQVGTAGWNLKVGRYEAEGLFAKGEDVYVADAGGPGTVETNKSRGRTAGALGLQFSPSETMTVEINTIVGNADDYEGETATLGMNKVGFRPALILSAGAISTSVGVDYYMEMPDDSDADREYTALGAGGKLEFALSDAMKIGGAFGYLAEEGKDENGDDAEDETTMSFSGYLTMGLGDDTLGIGAMMTQRDEADDSQMQGFVSYAHALPVEGLKVKFCGSFAQWSDGDDVTAYGGRMRFNYDF